MAEIPAPPPEPPPATPGPAREPPVAERVAREGLGWLGRLVEDALAAARR
jgi:hypothetical protein